MNQRETAASGQTREEIDFVRAGAAGGMNFGWRVMEGTQCTNLGGGPPCNDPGFTPPIVDYDHGQGCSVIGGYSRTTALRNALADLPRLGRQASPRAWALFDQRTRLVLYAGVRDDTEFRLTLAQIRTLHQKFRVPAEMLIRDYQLDHPKR